MSFWRSDRLHMLAGCFAMGGWAWFANRGHPAADLVKAALVQGIFTGLMTGVLKRVVEQVSARVSGPSRYLLPPAAAWAVSFGALLAVHIGIGTPELWWTLALPNLVATVYAALYAAALVRVG